MATHYAELGRHLFVGFRGLALDSASRRLLQTVRPGGVVLFARNVESRSQLRELTRALRTEIASQPIIAIDQEHGRVNRLRPIVGELPTIAELKAGGPAQVEQFGRRVGQTLQDCGIQLNFAPVVDLELWPSDTDNALQQRCWGRTAAEVIRWAGAFLDGMQSVGVAGCLKHFPGLGGSRADSHEQLPTVQRTREQLWSEDIAPFRTLQPRVSAIMVGHAHYPALEDARPKPASCSRRIVTELLRQQLGFDGVVLTDDLEMGAISQYADVRAVAVQAINAGADGLLVCHQPDAILAVYEALIRATETGAVSTARLAESAARLRRWFR